MPSESTSHSRSGSRHWGEQLASAVRTLDDLLARLGLDTTDFGANGANLLPDPEFPLFVPESFLERMEPQNPEDPLLRQVLPFQKEKDQAPGFVIDPLGENAARTVPGLLHKYAGRVLMIAARSCAINCRYCFRRNYPYQQEPSRLADWEPALDYIRGDESIQEVILSGGDPLMLTDRRLRELHDLLSDIPHLQRLRIHSRMPIVLPARVNDELLELLTGSRFSVVVVVHANHPHEIERDCSKALQKLKQAGMIVLNQAVLLRDINDSADVLAELCERLIQLGVLPYYLHQLDRVTGVAHFEVSVDKGRALIEELRRRLPGYAVPRYVQEQAGEPNKTIIEFINDTD
ncbi:L-lysine 2,3-aminomutase [Polystyrenella longa]|uniref:L-lysine 2,3-aminomutase n=1 Tax=Polystyrenella longa TaxID=2528007 RepID=A0A518CS60_9PLAN|nr:EF-P beta-lysylation protein EpmB [Polystyrenella longa]QDU82055.1 L-lysine 2,3-aminomutase [Polystyrenella longa]